MTTDLYNFLQPNYTMVLKEDLIGSSALVTASVISPGFIATFGGSATLQPNTVTEQGYQVIDTGGTATGKASISSSVTGLSIVLAKAYRFYASFKCGTGFLTDGVTTYKGMIGVTDVPNNITGTHGVGFFLDQTTPDPNFQVYLANGVFAPISTSIPIPTGLTVLEIIKEAGSDVIDLAVNGVLAHSFNDPANTPYGVPLGHTETLLKNAGASVVGLHWDWGFLANQSPNGRNPSFLA